MKFPKNTKKGIELIRFLIGGAINTAFTYGMYLALNSILTYQWAYSISYVLGILFSYWFNNVIVFKVPLAWKTLFAYPAVYIVQYGASVFLLAFGIEYLGIDKKIAPLLVTACMIPITFFLSKFILLPRRSGKQ